MRGRLLGRVALACVLTLALHGQTGASSPAAHAESAEAAVPPTLASTTPRSLSGMAVIGKDDETVGRVDAVARDLAAGELVLVVQTADGERLALSTDGVEASDGQLRLSYALSEEALQQRIAAFRQQRLADVDKDAQLAQLAAQPPAG